MDKHTSKRSFRTTLWLLCFGIVGVGLWGLAILKNTSSLYDGVIAMTNTKSSGSVERVELPGVDTAVNIVDWQLFAPGNTLSLVSAKHPLPTTFSAPSLVNTSVAHGDSALNMQVQQQIENPLRALYGAAERDGVEFMLSSAYRSVDDQKKLYDDFVAKQGAELAARYVALPGSSEHHTGLAVDFATASTPCQQDSNKCSLATADAEWLSDNAARFGFIQRYPEGKQPITGVGFEPWHYRYVGVPMARAIAQSSLTYDEAVNQIAPGYAKVSK